jgi:hypothetical protein
VTALSDHVALVRVSCDGVDDHAILECRREECMEDYTDREGAEPRRVWWTTDIEGLSPEDVVTTRNAHVRAALEPGVVHAHALLVPELPVCRQDVGEGERLGDEDEVNCPACLNVRAGGLITKRVEVRR